MSEKLIIKNFGPIKDMTFDLKKVNIFIGDQGTGKSTVAKTIVAVRNFVSREIFDLNEIDGVDKDIQQFHGHLDLVGIKGFLKKESFILFNSFDFQFEFSNQKIKVNKPKSLDKSLNIDFNFIPAERNMVHVLADSLYALLEVKVELPKLFLRFGNKYQSSRKSKIEFDYTEILGIRFIHKDNKDIILLSDNSEIDISEASAGIQGSVALLTVIDNIMSQSLYSGRSFLQSNSRLKLLVIEEPELNCFPKTQFSLLKYIIEKNKIVDHTAFISPNTSDVENPDIDFRDEYSDIIKNQLVITTHSPYILTSLNNLMYAYKTGLDNGEEVEQIIEKKYWLNFDDVSVYLLLKNGLCENIMDEELKQIKVEKIDTISETLSNQWHELANLNFAK